MSCTTDLLRRLNDPSLRWYIWKHFGRRVYGNITGTNQTLYICDDMICMPTRFSEYFKWWDPSTNAPGGRMFDREEAWDHVNETNPTTAYPRAGSVRGSVGYGGYFVAVQLTDGTNMVMVHIARKYRQLLITNMGYYIHNNTKNTINIPVKVYFPPTGQGLAYTTNGSVGADGVTISSGQYVLFYPTGETPYSVVPSSGIFEVSPIGANPIYPREIKQLAWQVAYWNAQLPEFYLGLPAPDGLPTDIGMYSLLDLQGSSINRGGINTSGITDIRPFFDLYDSDPYCSQGTWAGDKDSYAIYIGYATDGTNVVFLLASGLAFKHTTKKELRGEISKTLLYDATTKEIYILGWIKPQVNMYCYGRAGSVWTPSFYDLPQDEGFYARGITNPTKVVYVKPDDTTGTRTSPATTVWEYTDAYGFCDVWSDRAICYEVLGFYTDDTITINPKQCGFCRRSGVLPMKVAHDQLLPYSDRTLYAGKTYFAMARVWYDVGGQTDEYYATKIKKYTPKVITSTEWSSLMTTLPPYTLNLVGAAPHTSARIISYTMPPTAIPGQNITISGTVTNENGVGEPGISVTVLITDPETGAVVRQASTTTGSGGSYSVTIQAPTTPKTYRVYIIARKT